MVSQAAQEGDVLGLYAFGKIGEWLGRAMAATAAVLDPDVFVIGGGVVAVGDILLEPARYNYQRFLEGSAYRGHASIVAATAGQDAGPDRRRQPGTALRRAMRDDDQTQSRRVQHPNMNRTRAYGF